MDQIFKGILIASDLDGTIMTKDCKVPEKNLEAIEYFKSRGGKFTVATGRAIESARKYVDIIKPNAPCILFNGSMLYDFENEQVIWSNPIDRRAKEYTKVIMDKFPDIGVEVCTQGPINIVNNTDLVREHVIKSNTKCRLVNLDAIEKDWYKVLFAIDNKLIGEVEKYANSMPHEGVWYVASSLIYLEMLPYGANKGSALKKLTKYLAMKDQNTYAIGDYYNDVDLLSEAHFSAVPGNAPSIIKDIADRVVCRCEQGAIRDFIINVVKPMVLSKQMEF